MKTPKYISEMHLRRHSYNNFSDFGEASPKSPFFNFFHLNVIFKMSGLFRKCIYKKPFQKNWNID